jgi:hypothetical protein
VANLKLELIFGLHSEFFFKKIDFLGQFMPKTQGKSSKISVNHRILIQDWAAHFFFWTAGWPPLFYTRILKKTLKSFVEHFLSYYFRNKNKKNFLRAPLGKFPKNIVQF